MVNNQNNLYNWQSYSFVFRVKFSYTFQQIIPAYCCMYSESFVLYVCVYLCGQAAIPDCSCEVQVL